MGAGTGWFHANYWHANYWHATYWAPTGAIGGNYWHNTYWHQNYWHANYWAKTGDIGDVQVTDDATLMLAGLIPQVGAGPQILATTEALALTAFQADANLNIDPPITTASLSLTPFNLSVGTTGYVLGDLSLTFSPDSDITITYGMAPGAPPVGIQQFHPTTSTPDGLDVGVGTTRDLALIEYPVIANNPVGVQPVPQVLTLTSFDSPAAGIGELIEFDAVPRFFAAPTHTITGVPVSNVRVNRVVPIRFDAAAANVFGRIGLSVPPGTWPPDLSIVNPNADVFPSNYEICDRTGFKLERGKLVAEWTGAKVRADSFEKRNIQDFVRGVGDELTGSERPEQDDRFIDEEYVGGVQAADL
jgi:hypothetical protein